MRSKLSDISEFSPIIMKINLLAEINYIILICIIVAVFTSISPFRRYRSATGANNNAVMIMLKY